MLLIIMMFFLGRIVRPVLSFALAIAVVTVLLFRLLSFMLIDDKEKRGVGETIIAIGKYFESVCYYANLKSSTYTKMN